MVAAVPGAGSGVLMTFEYGTDPTVGDWCIMMDNHIIAWDVDTSPAVPVILGSMPTAPTDPLAPAWAQFVHGVCFVPDKYRGNPTALFTYIAGLGANGTTLYANFIDTQLSMILDQWKMSNTMWTDSPPNVAPPAPPAAPPDTVDGGASTTGGAASTTGGAASTTGGAASTTGGAAA